MKASRFARLAGVGMLAIGATIVQAAFVNAASAGVPTGRQVVRFSDLDLNRNADVARLYHRIRTAAESVCGERTAEPERQEIGQHGTWHHVGGG